MSVIVIALAFTLYLVNTLPLWHWLIDDAGISFVYSRNLAAGHGLVSQPGIEPVEGYSNFLWVLIMALFFLLNLFDPFTTSKVVNLILVLVSFILIHKITFILTNRKYLASFTVLVSISLNASFVIWTCSGLENALYNTLVLSLLYAIIRNSLMDSYKYKNILIISGLAFGIALTRPDGLVYFPLFAFIILFAFVAKRIDLMTFLRYLGFYSVLILIFYGSFILFRLLYFGEIYPNTYFAKGGPDMDTALSVLTLNGANLIKFREFLTSVVGRHLWLLSTVVMMMFGAMVVFFKERQVGRLALLLFTFTAGFVYMVLPTDWMGEYRFATPFFPLFYCSIVVTAAILLESSIRVRNIRSITGIGLAALLIATSVHVYQERLEKYQANPKVSFSRMGETFGKEFNRYAERLNIEDASLLVPDIGGALYYSNLRIYDLGGLCDKTIAQSRGKDQARFYDYIFEEIKPTFIHTHGYFTAVSKFDDDPRFLDEYTAIRVYDDSYVERVYKAKRVSGNFVRKDVVLGKENQLDSLRQELIK